MKIWLDDERPIPEGYDTYCRTAEQAIQFIKQGVVDEISLDNDLGTGYTEGKEVARFIERETLLGNLGRIKLRAHTSNVSARQDMHAAFRNIYKYWMNKNE